MNKQLLIIIISKLQECISALSQIKLQETANTAEWEQIAQYDDNDNADFRCSHCKHTDTQSKGVFVPFCWHCGSKMSYKENTKYV